MEIAVSKGTASPSAVLERWMEFLGSPPCPVWVRFKGVPLQAWHKDIFKLLDDCVGRIVEVDKKTAQKKILREGRAKIMLKKINCSATDLGGGSKIYSACATGGRDGERERMGRGEKRKSRETGCSVRMQLEIADRKKEETRG